MSYIITTMVRGFKYYVKFLDTFHFKNELVGLKNNATQFDHKHKAEAEIDFLPKFHVYQIERYPQP